MASLLMRELLDINLNNLNKNILQVKAKEIQDALRSALEEDQNPNLNLVMHRLEQLEKKHLENHEEITQLKKENKKLKARLNDVELDLDDAAEKFIELEKTTTKLDQYTRRENLGISGIPDNLPDDDLEDKALQILNTITGRDGPTSIKSKHIQAVHRLKKEKDDQNSKVIVRLTSRKHAFDVFKNKKKLQNDGFGFKDTFINENLGPETKAIFDVARSLKKKKLIFSCWTFNGVVHFKKKENDTRGTKVFHISEFKNYFSLNNLGWE